MEIPFGIIRGGCVIVEARHLMSTATDASVDHNKLIIKVILNKYFEPI